MVEQLYKYSVWLTVDELRHYRNIVLQLSQKLELDKPTRRLYDKLFNAFGGVDFNGGKNASQCVEEQ